ncbi:ThiF family adenylyltransferase [Photobacterium lutimaris]|uniref:THIF-type NAD/FAD binding fold domain-containing protein n=1 Tax=Photobacterium lutimaris TaxID=388278 RepID=A0A2T3IWG4_9GAMM|nr:ThiF family adenylyltransferase [Photobacterium lutimaris]PSU32790.1 hypothetical protein C9I99_17250 [Photobacterium lutimaris]TDR74405.1 tRNA A37 threonylcarbamoyladenosine dehydratase [Photobacterium lutimaris]
MKFKEFYAEFTLRNHGFISEKLQEKIQQANVLVAGCGSTGGAAVELLARTGFMTLYLTDNGEYELNNINRQRMDIEDIDKNKAAVHAEKVAKINPHLNIEVDTQGITADNVESFVSRSEIIVDGVDVTTTKGLEAKYLLHQTAKKYRKPVISGYDMDATQYVAIHDYRNVDEPILRGRVSKADIGQFDPLTICVMLITPDYLPLGILEELQRHEKKQKDFISQLGIAANLFGVIAVSSAVKILDDKQITSDIYIDMWEQLGVYEPQDIVRRDQFRDVWKSKLGMK